MMMDVLAGILRSIKHSSLAQQLFFLTLVGRIGDATAVTFCAEEAGGPMTWTVESTK